MLSGYSLATLCLLELDVYFLNMITSALISLLAWVISGFSLVLPSGSFLPSNFSDLISDVIYYAYGWDWLVPMSTIFSVISTLILFMVAELAWNSGRFLIALLRGN